MKTKYIFKVFSIFMILLTIAIGCAPWKMRAEHNVVKNGIPFEIFREYPRGLIVGTLKEDMVIDGWPCKRNEVSFFGNWQLHSLILSRDYERNGIFMPEGTGVGLDLWGNLERCGFTYDVEVQGHLCRGDRMHGFVTEFYQTSGKLKAFSSMDPVVIDGVPCKDSLFQKIYLHENGRLWKCKLNEPVRIDGKEFPRNAILEFGPTGDVTKQWSSK